MAKLSSLLKELDLIGPNFSLEYNENSRFKSLQGALISLIIYGFLVGFLFIFGTEVWERKKPVLTLSEKLNAYSLFSLYRFPLTLNLYTTEMQNVKNIFDYLSFEVIETYGAFTDPTDIIGGYRYNKYGVYKCNISVEYDLYAHDDFGDVTTLCPTFNKSTFLQNEYLSSNSTTYVFKVFKCDKSKRDCAADLDERFESLIFIFGISDSSIDPTNYTFPILTTESNVLIPLSHTLKKDIMITFSLNELISDYGWIFENFITDKFIKQSKVDFQYSIIDENSPIEKVSVIIQSSKQVSRAGRSYLKVQELFAKVGGVGNALLILFNLLFNNYLRFIYLQFIYEEAQTINSSSNAPFKKMSVSPLKNPQFVMDNNQNMVGLHNSNEKASRVSNNPVQLNHSSEQILGQDLKLNFNDKLDFSFCEYVISIITCKKDKTADYYRVMSHSKKLISLNAFLSNTTNILMQKQ